MGSANRRDPRRRREPLDDRCLDPIIITIPVVAAGIHGLLMAAGALGWWLRLRDRRLLIYALLTLASGLVAGWTLPGWLGAITVMCSVSVFYLVGGLLALRHLMRQPLAAEDRP